MNVILIDYNPETEMNQQKHDIWEKVANKYNALTTSDPMNKDGSSLLVSSNTDLEQLMKDLDTIKILKIIEPHSN